MKTASNIFSQVIGISSEQAFFVFQQVVERLVHLNADFLLDLDIEIDHDGLVGRFDLDRRLAGGEQQRQYKTNRQSLAAVWRWRRERDSPRARAGAFDRWGR